MPLESLTGYNETLPPLTDENIYDMVQAVQYRDYCDAQLVEGTFDEKDAADLLEGVEQGNVAMEAIFQHLRRLVPYILKNDFDMTPQTEQYDDCQQAGFIGIIKAAKRANLAKFRIESPLKSFISYTRAYIHSDIYRELDNSSTTIRLPEDIRSQVKHMKRRDALLIDKYASHVDLEYHQDKMVVGEKRLRLANVIANQILPIETERGWGSSREYADTDGNPRLKKEKAEYLIDETVDVEEEVILSIRDSLVVEAVRNVLSGRELEIVLLRFGLLYDEAMTLEEVGHAVGLTRERIRQIEARSLSKLRHAHVFEHRLDSIWM